VRARIAVAATLALLATAPPAAAWSERTVRESPGGAVATCLRDTGVPGVVGLLGRLERRMSPYELLRASGDRLATVRLGVLPDCPAVAGSPAGFVVAGRTGIGRSRNAMRVALVDAAGGVGEPVTLAESRAQFVDVAAAISDRGDAVVAWTELRGGFRKLRARVRVAVRPAGGAFGEARILAPWRLVGPPLAPVAAGVDAAGAPTVAWLLGHPLRRGGPADAYAEVATAAAGGAFGRPQRLDGGAEYDDGLALAVAPDGRALLAYAGVDTLTVHERRRAAGRFGRLRSLSPGPGAYHPAIAMRPGGGAVVGWRTGLEESTAGVWVATRSGPGRFEHGRMLAREPSFSVSVKVFAYGPLGAPRPPLDEEGRRLDVGLAADGRFVAAWGRERRLPLGDRPLAAYAAAGRLGGPVGRPAALGCPCRVANGVAALAGAEGVAFTDNVTAAIGIHSESELARRDGRLHIVSESGDAADPPAPRVAVQAARRRTLRRREPLAVRVRCSSACDLRATVVGERGRVRGTGSGLLREAGLTVIAIRSGFRSLAPRGSGRVRVVVRACAPNGRRSRVAAARATLRRRATSRR
jgi:hypothetical protein